MVDNYDPDKDFDAPVPEVRGCDDVDFYGGHLIAESIAAKNVPLIAAAPERKPPSRFIRRLARLPDT